MKGRLFTTFWHGRELNPISYTSLKSFVDYGHAIQLFTYENIKNVPKGVIVRNASDILPASELEDFEGRYANFSDLFRYFFLYKEGGFWVDTDVICIRDEVPSEPIYMAYEVYDNSSIGCGILALPKNSDFGKVLANYVYDPGLIPPWDGDDTEHRIRISKSYHSLRERRLNSGSYTFYGPTLLTNAAKHYHYTRFTRPYADVYSIGWGSWRNLFFNSNLTFECMDLINSWAVHCWGSICNGACDEILERGIGPLSEMIQKNWKESL